RPLSRLYDGMGEDMQAWCDIRHRAAAQEPQWISDAAEYYYDQVRVRIKDQRALEELCDWRDSITHKISNDRLIQLHNTPARLHSWRPARPQPAGGAISEGADVADTYRKDPEAISQLTPEQYRVTQQADTEPPFRNEFCDNKEQGIYVDIVSGEPLFASVNK